jgi:uncharacterized membrane protein
MPKDPLRYHRKHQTENVFGDSLAERAAEKVATGMGTVAFILVSTGIILGWVFINHAVKFVETAWHGLQTGAGFDPEPWILLNLIFSAVAFYTGALVIIEPLRESWRQFLLSGLSRSRLLVFDGGELVAAAV